jgi:hypothetical protein
MADKDTTSADKELDDIRNQIADTPKPADSASAEEKAAYRKTMEDLSKKAVDLRKKQIAGDSSLDDKEKKILSLYDQGVQIYAIAQQVYEFVNQDTVGRVTLTIRKAHADDWNQVEDINSTKGYTGVNR